MNIEEYKVVSKALRPVRMLGDIDEKDTVAITLLQLEADRTHSITLQLEVLSKLFRKDLEGERYELEKNS